MTEAHEAASPHPIQDVLTRWRVRVGFMLVAGVVTESVLEHERPLDLLHPTALVWTALAITLLGVLIRMAALGTLKKNRELAMKGMYSLCRHPLYLGSLLLYAGMGILLNDDGYEYWYLGIPYIALFYGAAIRREETGLAAHFGEAFARYREATPAIVPFGRFSRGEYSWARAWHAGGKMLISVPLMLVSLEAMARWL